MRERLESERSPAHKRRPGFGRRHPGTEELRSQRRAAPDDAFIMASLAQPAFPFFRDSRLAKGTPPHHFANCRMMALSRLYMASVHGSLMMRLRCDTRGEGARVSWPGPQEATLQQSAVA